MTTFAVHFGQLLSGKTYVSQSVSRNQHVWTRIMRQMQSGFPRKHDLIDRDRDLPDGSVTSEEFQWLEAEIKKRNGIVRKGF